MKPFRSYAVPVAAAVIAVLAPAPSGHAAAPHVREVCATPEPGFARCLAQVRTDVHAGFGVRGDQPGGGTACSSGG